MEEKKKIFEPIVKIKTGRKQKKQASKSGKIPCLKKIII